MLDTLTVLVGLQFIKYFQRNQAYFELLFGVEFGFGKIPKKQPSAKKDDTKNFNNKDSTAQRRIILVVVLKNFGQPISPYSSSGSKVFPPDNMESFRIQF